MVGHMVGERIRSRAAGVGVDQISPNATQDARDERSALVQDVLWRCGINKPKANKRTLAVCGLLERVELEMGLVLPRTEAVEVRVHPQRPILSRAHLYRRACLHHFHGGTRKNWHHFWQFFDGNFLNG